MERLAEDVDAEPTSRGRLRDRSRLEQRPPRIRRAEAAPRSARRTSRPRSSRRSAAASSTTCPAPASRSRAVGDTTTRTGGSGARSRARSSPGSVRPRSCCASRAPSSPSGSTSSRREDDVREAVEDFNRRVIEARRQLLGGPPVVTPTRDVDAEVRAWRERRRGADGGCRAARGDEPEPPRAASGSLLALARRPAAIARVEATLASAARRQRRAIVEPRMTSRTGRWCVPSPMSTPSIASKTRCAACRPSCCRFASMLVSSGREFVVSTSQLS